MSINTNGLRTAVEALPFIDAKVSVLAWIRIGARKQVYAYAGQNFITDYSDPILVEQFHRDFRQGIITEAQVYVADAQAAVDMAALLLVFDDIVPWIE